MKISKTLIFWCLADTLAYRYGERRKKNTYTPYGEYILTSRKFSNKKVNDHRSVHKATDTGPIGYRSKSYSVQNSRSKPRSTRSKCIRGPTGPTGPPGPPGNPGTCPEKCGEREEEPFIIPDFQSQRLTTRDSTDSNEVVRDQNQPVQKAGFSVALSGNVFNKIGKVILFDTLITDEMENYNFDSGAFISKSKGLYHFSASGTQADSKYALHFSIKRGYQRSELEDDTLCSAQSNGKHQTSSCQTVVQLEVGQRIYVKLVKGDLYASDRHYSAFSGFQIN